MEEIYHLNANILQVRPDIYTGVLWIVKGDLSDQKILSLKIPEGDLKEWKEMVDIPTGLMLKEVLNGVFIFSELKDPADPESSRILIIDSFSGKVLYDELGWFFDSIKDKSNFILKRPFQESIERKLLELEDAPNLNSFSTELFHPAIVHKSNVLYEDISRMLNPEMYCLTGAIEILETKRLLIASFHYKVGHKISKLLLLLDEKAQIINQFEISTQLDKYIEESFFVWGNFMIFVQDKMKLRFLNLDTILT